MSAMSTGTLATNVGEIELRRGGEGGPVPLVYLHSAQGEGEGMELLEILSESREVLAPVFCGFGTSEGIEQIDDIEDAAFWALDVLDRLDLRSVDLMGMSLGGWIAAELAVRWPERVRRLVLVNPVGLYVEGAAITEIFGRNLSELAGELFADPEYPIAQLMRALAQFDSDPSQIPFDLIRPVLQAQAATAKVGWNPYLHDPKLRRRLQRITAPTLVIHGAQDGIVPRAHAEAYVEAISGSRLEVLEGAAHLAALERAEDVAKLVLEHLG